MLRAAAFIKPCLPSPADKPPSGSNWTEFGLVAAMPALLQKTLKVAPAPLAAVPTAPPAEAPNPTVELKCGNCSVVLMRVDEGKAYPLMIDCTSCDAFNSTDA